MKKYKLLRFERDDGSCLVSTKLNVTRVYRDSLSVISIFCFFSEWIFCVGQISIAVRRRNVVLFKLFSQVVVYINEHPRLELSLRKIAATDVYLLHIRLRMSSRLVGQ